ncbi:uncharacterized protein LOC115217079 [Argonauta hians]
MADPAAIPYQKRKFCYKGSERNTSADSKRRKASNETNHSFAAADDDDWDADLTLTQQELHDLDNATSNAYAVKAGPSSAVQTSRRPAPNAPNVAAAAAAAFPGPRVQFLHPKQQDVSAPQQPVPRLAQRTSSSSSSASSAFPVSSTTSYDSSTSSVSSAAAPSSPPRPTTDHSNGEVAKSTLDEKLIEELLHLRKESKKYNAVRHDLYLKEGEIKILRKDLQEATEKLSKVLLEKSQQEIRERSESEKLLKCEVERLGVQLQFKEQEIVQLKDSLLNVKSSAISTATSPRPAAPGTSKVRRVQVEKQSPQKRCASLTEDPAAVGADGISLRRNGKNSVSPRKNASVCRKRKKVLNVHLNHGKLTGSQLTSKLVQDTFTNSQTMPSSFNGGIIQLLQPHSTQHFGSLKFSRDSSSFLLKQKSKSLTDLWSAMNSVNKKDLVSSSNLNLAIHGLSQLLITDRSPEASQSVLSTCSWGSSTATTGAISSSSAPTTTTSMRSPSQSPLNLLLRLMPLLSDYLGHYCDQLSTSLVTSSCGGSGGLSESLPSANQWKSGSSSESSMDSVTSSVNLLLQDCANVANQLELLVIVALRVLLKLIGFCAELRHSLLVDDTDTKLASSLSSSLSMTSPNQKSGKSSVLVSLLQDMKKFDLITKLFLLANPLPDRLINPRIVEIAVSVLILLAKSGTREELESFLPAISDGVIKNCLNYDKCFEIQLIGLRLFLTLSCSESLMTQVCATPKDCLLLNMYQMSYQLLQNSADCKVPLQLHHTVIEILTTLCCQQPSGASCLVESHCPCNMECVKCCVCVLYHILEQHQHHCNGAQYDKEGEETFCSLNPGSSSSGGSPDSRATECACETVLYQGAFLLYTISLREQNFYVRDVLHKYTILISHLKQQLRQEEIKDAESKIEVSAMKELWDFVTDSDLATEDEEVAMETS